MFNKNSVPVNSWLIGPAAAPSIKALVGAQAGDDHFDPDKGRKFDSGKPMMSLLPPHAMLAVGRVLTFGAQKYSKDNWKRVPSAKQRYMDAMMRHAFHFMSGEEHDSETGENHLAHLICCASFILDAAESGNDLPE